MQETSLQFSSSAENIVQTNDEKDPKSDNTKLYNYNGETVLSAIEKSVHQLEISNAPEPLMSSCHLLSYALDLPWANGFSTLLQLYDDRKYIMPNNENHSLAFRTLTESEARHFKKMCISRENNEPLQYIIGKWDFYHNDMVIYCRKPMLCPRPETEELVEIMIHEINSLIKKKQLSDNNDKKVRILDVGCGTGAIGIAIAKQFMNEATKIKNEDIQMEVVAIDILQEAVDLSTENARQILGKFDASTRCDKIQNNGVEYKAIMVPAADYTNNSYDKNGELYKFDFDIVVSNPPYIPSYDMESLSSDVVDFESELALCGGTDGMDVIRDIVRRLPEWTKFHLNNEYSQHTVCWMEVDTSHPKLIQEWLNKREDENEIIILSKEGTKYGCNVKFLEGRKDLCGRDRFVKLSVTKEEI